MKNNNNSIITATAILAQTLIAALAMTLVTLASGQSTIPSNQVGQPWVESYPTKSLDIGSNWKQYTEQELNLRQDTRNLLYVGGLLACGAIMNNNGNDDFAVGLAGGIVLTAGVDNVLSIIRRNKKLNL